AERALQLWSEVANIQFVRVGSGTSGPDAYSDNATILFGNYTAGDTTNSFTYQGELGHTASNDFAGDVWINANFSYNLAPSVGNYGMMALVHEIGHAMGFNHPSNY